MEKWYKVSSYSHKIEEVEVVKHTEKCVWYKYDWFGKEEVRKAAKISGGNHYFESWQEAHSFLLDRYERKVQSLKQATHEANSLLGQVRKMKEPIHE